MTPTRIALLVVAGIAAVTEAAALIWPERLPLISPTMRRDGLRWVVWPAGWGTLGGHFWSPSWLRFEWAVQAGPYVLCAVGSAVLLFDFFGPRVSVSAAFVLMLACVPVGAIFWSQK